MHPMLHILLIEPQPERTRVFVHSLASLRVVVTSVTKIEQARQVLSHIQPDVILVSTPPDAGSDLEAWLGDMRTSCPKVTLDTAEPGRLTLVQGWQPGRSPEEASLCALQLGQD